MINRNEVAREKLAQAAILMRQQNIDLWVVYSRKKQDPSLELLFSCSSENEILFMIWKNGDVVALANQNDIATLQKSGLYNKIIEATPSSIMELFMAQYSAGNPQTIALNTCLEDARCDGLAVGLYKKLQSAIGSERFCQIERSSYPILEELRAIKSQSEIAIMQECSTITTDIYDEVFAQISVGMSETQIADLMMAGLRKRGCGNGIGNPDDYPIVCLVRCGLAHRKPSPDNFVQGGDMLVMDFSARYNGYTSDIARTVYFLKQDEQHAPDDVRHCVESVIKAVSEVYAIIKPGLHGYEVDRIGRASIVASGYPQFPHSTGHQVGLECHDGGTILGKDRAKPAMAGVLRAGEIYAIEPTVLQDGGLPCAIVEDNVLLTQDGYRLISKRQTSVIEIAYKEAGGCGTC